MLYAVVTKIPRNSCGNACGAMPLLVILQPAPATNAAMHKAAISRVRRDFM
jgi:hypothetical protein